MRTTAITNRLRDLGGAKWGLHFRAVRLAAQGHDIVQLTIGEPDTPPPATLIDAASDAMRAGRTTYSKGEGEDGLRDALAKRYAARIGRAVTPDQIMCFPGTQTALFTVLMGIAEAGDEVLVGDPMYATYEGVVRASGANVVPVPLRAENGFRLNADDLAARITPRSRAILINTPHNPTGAVLSAEDIAALGRLARAHDLWIVSDEVYDELIHDDTPFVSPLSFPELAKRTIVVSSISKSHAAPGFRSGWCVGPEAFTAALLPLSETMLFGNQPFIADMTEKAIRDGSQVAPGMRERYAARAAYLADRLAAESPLRVLPPSAGMFAMINVAGTGMDGEAYANHLLDHAGVAVMPGASFGATLKDWVRLALTVPDADIARACDRMVAHAAALTQPA
ncbi:pyridoxal phosphate-dependent aminotransferase [Citreicella sp. C3M06]|uniref:pyridoxal phosphate-dependent aminotransferase n=1 Tax=Citreicella sp. C3M06 TaxID=2841564 RepID=UPI001C09577B|nr:pyridoxal phosphate-dependent aminotransferase [Citreicella sp. C3M06]MBU2959250.1 pyridoxal phosphate-dependent aminotransferase [Citreicella sp. C3M06]